jgi:hypothetical protein
MAEQAAHAQTRKARHRPITTMLGIMVFAIPASSLAASQIPSPELLNAHRQYAGCGAPAEVTLTDAARKKRNDRDPEKVADSLRRIYQKYPELRCDRRPSR